MIFIDKNKDGSHFLVKANQRGEWVVTLFIKFFAIGATLINIMNFIGSIFFSLIKYDDIIPDALYHPYRFMYVV